jgi:high-affinity iron transporter
MTDLINFAVVTIFAREVLEGGIIIGEYRTVILRSKWDENSQMTQQEALRTVTLAALVAAAVAVVVCAAIAIPLAVLSKDFNAKTAMVIEGVSKIVAAVCILGLSLKMPKLFGLYYSKSQVQLKKSGATDDEESHGLTKQSIRFNVAWNIWREVAECGVFLIPFFLTGEGIKAIPLSAVVGSVTGGIVCVGIYIANQRMKSTVGLTIFTVSLLIILSTGLFSGGCNKFEMAYGYTTVVWQLQDDFWSVDRLPMTIFKPFGYSDTRTVVQIITFWVWLFFSLILHYRKYKQCRKPSGGDSSVTKNDNCDDVPQRRMSTPATSVLDDGSSEGAKRGESSNVEDVEEGATADRATSMQSGAIFASDEEKPCHSR